MLEQFSRSNPSPRYKQLVEIYSGLHRDNPEIFAGRSLLRHLPTIRDLVQKTGAQSILDYGSGKGAIYDQRELSINGWGAIPSPKEYLSVTQIRLYDPCVPIFSAFPTGQFDGVISTDVLEHIPTSDLHWVVDEMFALSRKFVFAVVASFPAKKQLPTGENAHESQKSYWWWRRTIRKAAVRHPGIAYRFEIERCLHPIKFLPNRRVAWATAGGSDVFGRGQFLTRRSFVQS